MSLGIAGKRALVTGASKGIGAAVARQLAVAGANLTLCARGVDDLERFAAEIRTDHGVDVLTVAADVGKSGDIDKLIESTHKRFGGVDILVINPGHPPTSFEAEFGYTDQDWFDGFEQLVLSAVRLTRGTVPAMAERGWGRVVLITTLLAREPSKDHVLSGALRVCSQSFLKSIATEYAGRGVTCNAVLPGAIDTPRQQVTKSRALASGRVAPDISLGIPVGRMGTADEVASAVRFLASADASYITGAMMPVDGGALRSL
ncbi:MAG: SDR family oxidoreductase [Acidimicrobiia bacterium]